jgi:hypothetical protein
MIVPGYLLICPLSVWLCHKSIFTFNSSPTHTAHLSFIGTCFEWRSEKSIFCLGSLLYLEWLTLSWCTRFTLPLNFRARRTANLIHFITPSRVVFFSFFCSGQCRIHPSVLDPSLSSPTYPIYIGEKPDTALMCPLVPKGVYLKIYFPVLSIIMFSF